MTVVAITRRIEAPADLAWEHLSWRGLERLAGGVFRRLEFGNTSAVPGSVRRIHLGDSSSVLETLEEIDETHRMYRYRVIDDGPLPVTDYQGYVRVTPAGTGACNVKFESRATPVGVSDDAWRAIWLEMENNVLDELTARLAQAGEQLAAGGN